MQIFDRIVTLSLRGPAITDEAVADLSRLRHLEALDLQTTMVSAEWVRRFQAANPDCEISHGLVVPVSFFSTNPASFKN